MPAENPNSVESSYYDEESEVESVYEKDDAYDYVEEEEENDDDEDEEYVEEVTKKSKLNNRQPNIINRSSSRINSKKNNNVKDDEPIIKSSVRKEIVPIIQDDDEDEEEEEQEAEEKEEKKEKYKEIEIEENQDVAIEEEDEDEDEEEEEDTDMEEDEIEIPEVSETPMPDGNDVDEEEEEEEASTNDYQISLEINSKESTADIPKRIVRSRMLKDILDYSDSNNKQEEMLTEEEIQLRRAENARKRKNLKDKKLEEEKRDTINKLLKKRAGKARTRQQGNGDESSRASPNKDSTIKGGENGDANQISSIFQKPRRPYLADGMIRTVITAERILYCPRN